MVHHSSIFANNHACHARFQHRQLFRSHGDSACSGSITDPIPEHFHTCVGGILNSFATADAVSEAVRRGAKLINCSFGGPADSSLESVISAATQAGVLVVASAGNSGSSQPVPGEFIKSRRNRCSGTVRTVPLPAIRGKTYRRPGPPESGRGPSNPAWVRCPLKYL